MSNLTNGEAGNSFPCKKDKSPRQGSNTRHGNMGSNVTNASLCSEKNGGERKMEEISGRDEADNLDGNMDTNLTSKRVRIQKEITMEDMLNTADDYGEEDDSDWEPLQMEQIMTKWFCINCTMVNLGDAICCEMCGENKESAIFWHGFFGSSFPQEIGITQTEADLAERHRVSSQSSATSNSTAVGFDKRMLLHSEAEMRSQPHPERPDRVRAIAASLASAGIFPGKCFAIPAREITKQELERVHSSEHVEDVNFTSRMYSSYFTPDTYANEHSACAARLAAGLCADLASAIFSGRVKNGFALVRPPGHHAGVSQAMGFCLHNNAAVAAVAAQAAGAKKILIVDWDVHHGNGTQEIFDSNKSVLYVSLHRHEGGNFYPGTGAADEVGSLGAEGYCVNVPWSQAGVGDNDYMFAFQHVVLPIVSEFMPDFTIVSAGFDAARGDPLGCCDITPAGYAQMTHMLNGVSGGKLLVILEGGYNLRSISASAVAVIKVLLGDSSECGLENCIPSSPGLTAVLEVLKIQMPFWPTLESSFTQLQAQGGSSSIQYGKKDTKKRHRAEPVWWKFGPRRLFYQVLYKRHLHRNPRHLR